jgi:hypothetical protein
MLAGIGSGLVLFLVVPVVFADIISGVPSTGHSTDVTITQLTLAKPTVATGDLMLANVSVNGGSAATITAPAGWTQILRTDNDTNLSLVSYYKIADASEPGSYTWSIDHQTTAEGAITPYRGIDATNPIDTSAGNTSFGTVATTTSVTTSSANDEVVTLFAADIGKSNNAGAYFTTPAGLTEKYDITNTPFGPSTSQDEAIQAAAGSTGSQSSTISGGKSRNWATQTIALHMKPVTTLANGLVAYWKMDESTGNAVDELSSLTLTNQGAGTASFVPGKINNGLSTNSFDQWLGVSSGGTSVDLANTDVTINTWVKYAAGNSAMGIGIYGVDNTHRSYLFYGDTTYLSWWGNPTTATVSWSGSTATWYMLTVTYNTTNGDVKFYVNGVQQDSTQTAPTGAPTGNDDLFTVGGWNGSSNFAGITDEVGVWNRQLTQAEITQLYNSGSGNQYPF